MKKCTKCGTEKSETDFHRAKHGRGGVRSNCKSCAGVARKEYRAKNPERTKAASKAWQDENHDRVIELHLLKKFGLSLKDFQEMLQSQRGVCAICTKTCKTGQRLSVDHVHNTNPPRVRGLLCRTCNTGLGGFHDSPVLLFSAIDYLRKVDPLPAGLMPCY